MRIRTYSDLIQIGTYEDRFRYLALGGSVGASTFGFDRYINQQFYRSRQWRQTRQYVIARDEGLDLAMPGYEINSQILIHHMNPIAARDIELGDPAILDPEFLITTTQQTHNVIHYGDERQLPRPFVPRRPGDTKLW